MAPLPPGQDPTDFVAINRAEKPAPTRYVREEKHNVYFLKDRSEGMMIPLTENEFLHPHPGVHIIDDFVFFPSRDAES